MKNILEANTKVEVLARIKVLTESSTAKWGKMNVNQMIVHCTDQIRMTSGEVKTADTSTFFSRTFMKFMAMRVKAPKGKVETLPEVSQEISGTKPIGFEADRDTLLVKLEEFLNASGPFHAHGFFGDFTKEQWARMIYQHLDHHLEQFGA